MSAGSALVLVILLTRHGVRSLMRPPPELAAYAAQPWPAWEVPPGELTPQGRKLLVLMGRYYRERYVAEGLLGGDPRRDAASLFLRADSDERTVDTAVALAEGLAPGVPVVPAANGRDAGSRLDAKPRGTADPLFAPAALDAADRRRAVAAIGARMARSRDAALARYAPAIDRLNAVLFGGNRPATGKLPVAPAAAWRPGPDGELFRFGAFPRNAATFAEAFLLEYADGKPLSQVGWGRADEPGIVQMLAVHSYYFDLRERTPFLAQVGASNLAYHLERTIDQAAAGRPETGAIGPLGERLLVVAGHDGNLAAVGGLLGITWEVPEVETNALIPGGALVFELYRDSAGRFRVRVAYAAPTPDQMRNATALTLAHPPAWTPTGFDRPLDAFDRLVAGRALRRFVR